MRGMPFRRRVAVSNGHSGRSSAALYVGLGLLLLLAGWHAAVAPGLDRANHSDGKISMIEAEEYVAARRLNFETTLRSRVAPQAKLPMVPNRSLPQLRDRHRVVYTWGGGDSDDADFVELLNSIDASSLWPQCSNFLLCVHDAALALSQTEKAEGFLIVATGTGRVGVVRWESLAQRFEDNSTLFAVLRRMRPRITPQFRHVRSAIALFDVDSAEFVMVHGATMLQRPAAFHVNSYDVDLDGWAARMPLRWAGIMDALRERFPFLFFAHTSPTVHPRTGRLRPRVIPIPHERHFTRARADAQLLFKYNEARDRPSIAFASRPRKIFWRGTTSGSKVTEAPGLRPYESLPFLNHTDRGKIVALLHDERPGISDCYFTRSYGPNAAGTASLTRGEVAGTDGWLRGGRLWLDVDGFSNSWEGLRWKLRSGGPVVKIRSSQNHVQWYYHMLTSGVHLLELDVDQPDLVSQIEALLDDATRAERMVDSAARFMIEECNAEVAREYLLEAIARCYELADEFQTRDWRVRPGV